MSDAEDPTTDFEPIEPNTGEEYEPLEVFPDDEDFDLRPGADSCYKCSTCDTNCPVAEVDDDFPGPKFQGPEQWRLKQTDDDYEIDDSITECSNCLRCDTSCPSGVSLAQMHNTARGEYVDNQMSKFSMKYIRNRILANYRTSAYFASMFPRTSNFVMNFGPVRWVMEKVMHIPSERDFPEFATQTFRQWWNKRGGNAASEKRAREARAERGGSKVQSEDKRIAYFHGCYSNYNTPEVGKALVRVYEHFGYEVMVPPQKCSGTPMFANGMLDDARRHAETNVDELTAAIEDGADIVTSCTSCSMALRNEYPELFDIDGIDDLAAHTFNDTETTQIYTDVRGELEQAEVSGELADEFAYHAPCHARNQGLERQAIELFRNLDGVGIEDVGDSCSGISGTYGWKSEKYEKSMEIGAEMFEHMEDADGETGMTECPTCASQMNHGTGYEIRHPMELIEAALIK